MVVSERYIRPKIDVKKLLEIVDPLQNNRVLSTFLTVLGDLLIHSFDFNIHENFKFFLDKKKKYLDKFFLIYQYSNTEEIKVKMAVVFSLIGLDSECWDFMKFVSIIFI